MATAASVPEGNASKIKVDLKRALSLDILEQALDICELILKVPPESSVYQNLELREKLNTFSGLKLCYKEKYNREWKLDHVSLDEALITVTKPVKAHLLNRDFRNRLSEKIKSQIDKVANLRQGKAAESEITKEEQVLSKLKSRFEVTQGEEWSSSIKPIVPRPTCLITCPTNYLVDPTLSSTNDSAVAYWTEGIKPLMLVKDLENELGESVRAVFLKPTFKMFYVVRCLDHHLDIIRKINVIKKVKELGACEENISSAMTALSVAKENFKSYSGIQYPFVKGHVLPDFPTGCQKSQGNNVCLADITTFKGEESKFLTIVSPGVTVWKIKKASELTEDEKLYCPHITNLRDLLEE